MVGGLQVGEVQQEFGTRRGLASEDFFGHDVFYGALDDAAHGAGAKLGVVALADEAVQGGGGQLDTDVLIGQGAVDFG